MPKVKTNKSASKRLVRITKTGKMMMRKMSITHRSRFKSKRAKRMARHHQAASKGMQKKLSPLFSK